MYLLAVFILCTCFSTHFNVVGLLFLKRGYLAPLTIRYFCVLAQSHKDWILGVLLYKNKTWLFNLREQTIH